MWHDLLCEPPRGSALPRLGELDETATILAGTPFALGDPSSRGSAALPPVWWAGSTRDRKGSSLEPPFRGVFLLFGYGAHYRQVGMGEQAKGYVAVPAVPLPYLVFVEADLALGLLEAICYDPAPARDFDQLVDGRVRRSVAQVVGDLLLLLLLGLFSCDTPAHQQPASRSK